MVQAILSGAKTQTMRPINPQPEIYEVGQGWGLTWKDKNSGGSDWLIKYCPFGQKGDRLYVREAWSDYWMHEDDAWGEPCQCGIQYRASWDPNFGDEPPWKPSIHMKKEDARIWLEITNVSVIRINDVTAEDCYREGIKRSSFAPAMTDPTSEFIGLWNSIYKNWNKNPWAWVIKFKKV